MLIYNLIKEVIENKKDACHNNRILSAGKILLLYLGGFFGLNTSLKMLFSITTRIKNMFKS